MELGDTVDGLALHVELVRPPPHRESPRPGFPAIADRLTAAPRLARAIALSELERSAYTVLFDRGLPSAGDRAKLHSIRRPVGRCHPEAPLSAHAATSLAKVATVSTCAVWGKRSKARIDSIRHAGPSLRTSRASVLGSHET